MIVARAIIGAAKSALGEGLGLRSGSGDTHGCKGKQSDGLEELHFGLVVGTGFERRGFVFCIICEDDEDGKDTSPGNPGGFI